MATRIGIHHGLPRLAGRGLASELRHPVRALRSVALAIALCVSLSLVGYCQIPLLDPPGIPTLEYRHPMLPQLPAELQRVNRLYPQSTHHTDAQGRVWLKTSGRWSHVPGRQGELQPAPVQTPAGSRPGFSTARGSVSIRPFPRRLSGRDWTYYGRGSLADHLRRVHGAAPHDLLGRSSRELRQMHSNAHNYGRLY